ncbi:MAG TPA: hypothetical protein VEK35_06800 [Roseiarcus sp.]|nr:hypothetical protein [Roseiarcus sp.]
MSKPTMNPLVILAFLASASLAGGALAQTDTAPATAPAAPAAATPAADAAAEKPKPKPKPMITVVVTNSRKTGLAELDATPDGASESKKILTKLAAGKKATIHLPKGKSCVYDLRASYDDGASADMSAVDLCTDGKINLVE